MICIFDNGQEYEDHAILFVDIGGLSKALAVPLLLEHMYEDGYEEAILVAIVERIEWLDDGSLTPVAALWEQIHNHTCMVQRCRDKEVEPFMRAANEHSPDGLAAAQAMVAISNRVWTPEECACTCASGKLRALAMSQDS